MAYIKHLLIKGQNKAALQAMQQVKSASMRERMLDQAEVRKPGHLGTTPWPYYHLGRFLASAYADKVKQVWVVKFSTYSIDVLSWDSEEDGTLVKCGGKKKN